MKMMTVMLIGGGVGELGLQPPPLIKATRLNGLLVPWVTDRASYSNLSPQHKGHINCRLPWTEVFVDSGVSTGGNAVSHP